MTQPQPIELDADFPIQDYIQIGGDKSPGKATIRGAGSPRGWDERKGYALSGSTLVPTGDELSKFEVLIELWDENDVPLWYAFAAKWLDKSVKLTPGSTVPRPLAIQHPILAAPPIRITNVVVEDCSALEEDDEGGWSCVIKFREYRRPRPAPSAPVATIPAASSPQPTAEDQADKDIQSKLAAFQALASAP